MAYRLLTTAKKIDRHLLISNVFESIPFKNKVSIEVEKLIINENDAINQKFSYRQNMNQFC